MMANNSWTPTRPLPASPAPEGHVPPRPMPSPGPPPKNDAVFRVRKSRLGNKCILQKFGGDVFTSPPPGFRDVPWPTGIGAFNIVPREDWERIQKRFELAEKRAGQQRRAREKKKDFEASRLAPTDKP